LSLNSIQIENTNELDSMCGISDDELIFFRHIDFFKTPKWKKLEAEQRLNVVLKSVR